MASTTLPGHDWEAVNERFVEYRRTRDKPLRDELVEANRGLAHHFVKPYLDHGMERDDLEQVALIGLVKAVERFDPSVGAAFASFARRYVVGEIRHHFRDRGWDLKVPRGIKELHTSIAGARRDLTASLGQDPTAEELALHLDVGVDDVLEALDAGGAYAARSLDQRREALGSAAEPAQVDDGFLTVERRALLTQLLEELDERERMILVMRFEQEMSQDAIAEQVGVSQVHVGRILRATLAALRERAHDDPDATSD